MVVGVTVDERLSSVTPTIVLLPDPASEVMMFYQLPLFTIHVWDYRDEHNELLYVTMVVYGYTVTHWEAHDLPPENAYLYRLAEVTRV